MILSIFPGIDMLGEAFAREGWCVVRGPDVIWGGDIRTFHPPAGCWDGVIGGPPCQSFSPLSNLVRAKGYEPKFGNLIPEFARCVLAAQPSWYLMEEVPRTPAPETPGYDVVEFGLEHSALDSGDGYGHEQMRRRLFRFGVRDGRAVDLRRWILTATWLLPMRAATVTETHVDSPEAKLGRVRTQAVTHQTEAVPVALGGSGKRKPGARVPCVTGTEKRPADNGAASRVQTVTGAHSGSHLPRAAGGVVAYTLAESLRLQGLPEDWLEHCPFTQQGARKAVANGVPLPMGLALARAIRAWQREVAA